MDAINQSLKQTPYSPTSQSGIFGFLDISNKDYLIVTTCYYYLRTTFTMRETENIVGVCRGFSTPVQRFGRPNNVPKLMKNCLEKISLIKILRDKILIATVSKDYKKSNFKASLFSKNDNHNCFHLMFQPDFTSNLLLCVL